MTRQQKSAAKIFASMGGKVKSKKKTAACRRNGLLGGRPLTKSKKL